MNPLREQLLQKAQAAARTVWPMTKVYVFTKELYDGGLCDYLRVFTATGELLGEEPFFELTAVEQAKKIARKAITICPPGICCGPRYTARPVGYGLTPLTWSGAKR